MHSFHLGILKDFLQEVMWELILSDAFVVRLSNAVHRTETEVVELTCEVFRAALLKWYSTQPPGDYTHFQDFSHKLIGTKDNRYLKSKAAELKGLLFFVVDLLSKRDHVASRIRRGDLWLAAAHTLKDILVLLKRTPMVVTTPVYQETFNK